MLESADLAKDSTDTLFQLTSEPTNAVSGGFADGWDDDTSGDNTPNNNNTPFKIHYYRLRIWTSKPCAIWSSQVNNYHLASQAPGGVDTRFNQQNISMGTIKKWQMTAEGGYWSKLNKQFSHRIWDKRKKRYVTRGKPLYVRDAALKWQVKNLDPKDPPSVAQYYGVVEVGIEYDMASTG